MPPDLQIELYKRDPFDSPEQEAYLALARTSAVLSAHFDELFKRQGLTQPAYNALRILRGAGPEGRSCDEVGQHLVTQVPDVTRLIDRLQAADLATRTRSTRDKRVTYVKITPKGLALLGKLDAPVLELHRAQLGGIDKAQLRQAIVVLAHARELTAQLVRELAEARGDEQRPTANGHATERKNAEAGC